jgi:phospholipase/carboxylesterase
MMDFQVESLQIQDWVVKVRTPAGPGPHPLVLMVHGLAGDENVMWVFASRLPENALLVAPRALYPAGQGGYTWHVHREDEWPSVDDLKPAAEALLGLITPEHFPDADLEQVSAVGFSQGAAVLYTLALTHPGRLRALAGLAGFLPEGAENLAAAEPLKNLPVFVAHGVRDERVPVERARRAVEVLEQAGADVTYCEDDVGHKLSLNCFKALERFFKGL